MTGPGSNSISIQLRMVRAGVRFGSSCIRESCRTYCTEVRNHVVHHSACNPLLHFEYRELREIVRFPLMTSFLLGLSRCF